MGAVFAKDCDCCGQGLLKACADARCFGARSREVAQPVPPAPTLSGLSSTPTPPSPEPQATSVPASLPSEPATRSPWPKTIFLVRHAESHYNAFVHRHQMAPEDPSEYWDASLTEKGEIQARVVTTDLSCVTPLDLVLMSPLSRSIETCLYALPFPDGARRYEVTPLIAEHLEAACDIGRPPTELSNSFPMFDFCALENVWWWVPEEEKQGICPNRSRELFAKYGRREPLANVERRIDLFAQLLAVRDEKNIAVFGHADAFNVFLSRYFVKKDPRFCDYWMRNCEVVPVVLDGPEDLLPPPPPVETSASVDAEIPRFSSDDVPSRRVSAASLGIADLRKSISESDPSLKGAGLQRMVSRRWREMDAEKRQEWMAPYRVSNQTEQ
eukprot:TRINITY_DN29283_c0_g1_i1.p1 TRINITY_DN29283_c0_g1~~TRINITY_DN29283_c0_g1_i1.p1  ORF type:complete len:384 (+),score=47.17 TRINITY_DN29283_c0_g1_i1:205-1356(+)